MSVIFQKYIDDITRNRGEKDWIVIVAGEQIVKNSEYDFHFELGGEKGETSFDFLEPIPNDMEKVKQLQEK